MFALEPTGNKGGLGLIHESTRGRFLLSSDTIANSNRRRSGIRPFYEQMPDDVNAEFHNGGVAARILFPANRIEGGRTVNGARGMDLRIADRFDLTLECVRRFYSDDLRTPLGEVLTCYRAFFDVFETFDQYVRFFYLDDLVEDGLVRFYLPFEEFGDPLPSTFDEYERFRVAQVAFVSARRERMRAALASVLGPLSRLPHGCDATSTLWPISRSSLVIGV